MTNSPSKGIIECSNKEGVSINFGIMRMSTNQCFLTLCPPSVTPLIQSSSPIKYPHVIRTTFKHHRRQFGHFCFKLKTRSCAMLKDVIAYKRFYNHHHHHHHQNQSQQHHEEQQEYTRPATRASSMTLATNCSGGAEEEEQHWVPITSPTWVLFSLRKRPTRIDWSRQELASLTERISIYAPHLQHFEA